MIIVGIDPGVITGLAVWDDTARVLCDVRSLKLHQAMQLVLELKPGMVIFEDARQRSWFGSRDSKQRKFGAGVREGAGSVKRDCAIWEDFLTDLGIPYIARCPSARGTKWKEDRFKALTQWKGRTSEHARDAAILVFGISATQLEVIRRQSELRVTTLRKARATRRRRKQAAAQYAVEVMASVEAPLTEGAPDPELENAA